LDAGITEKVIETAAVSIDQVVRELVKIGFANVKNYIRLTADGEPAVDFSDVTEDQFAALSEVSVEDFVDGRTEADETLEPQPQGGELRRRRGREVRKVRFKIHNKEAALVDLLKHLGGFPPQKHEHAGEGGGAIKVDVDAEGLSELELGRRIAFALEKAARARPAEKPKKAR
jgi:phage terminase small subunit